MNNNQKINPLVGKKYTNPLVELIIREFAERFVPGGRLLYLGDTDEKFAYFDEQGLAELGVTLEPHGNIPDIIL